MLYIIPRWSPESARICDAPLSRNAVETSLGMPVLSPVMSAESRLLVVLSVNGMLSIDAFILRPMSVMKLLIGLPAYSINDPLILYEQALMHPHAADAIIINVHMQDEAHLLWLGSVRHMAAPDAASREICVNA